MGNRLLAALPAPEQQRLAPFLEDAVLRVRQSLIERGEPIEYVYFPIGAVTSSLIELGEGDSVEVGLMGAEGFVGLPLLYGEPVSNMTVIAQIAGSSMRMRADDFRREVVERDTPAWRIFLRFANAFFTTVAQLSACNASHDVQSRFARWLLMVHDRVGRDEFPLTQEFAGLMLGVRRATVTHAAGGLRTAGAIEYETGRFFVRHRPTLVKAACSCYPAVTNAMDSLFASFTVERGPPHASRVR
jgi:CRP-like cAMP-binding protein